MSTGSRVLNFTGRKRIRRKDVRISLLEAKHPDPPVVSVDLDIPSYELPAHASVFVEAYRQVALQRFDYGTIGNIKEPEDRRLLDFETGDGVLFRVKVVDVSSGERHAGLILAQADGLSASMENRKRSLLCLVPDPELRDEVWRLEATDDNVHPEVRVSRHLIHDHIDFGRSNEFLSLSMPEILRRILRWALAEDRPEEEDGWHQPRGQWLRLAIGMLEQKDLPEHIDGPNADGDQRDEWVERVVTRFCRTHRIDNILRAWWEDGAGTAAGGQP